MSFLLGAVRRLATLPLVRRLTSVTPLLRLSYSLRATLVRERAGFVRNELRGPVTAIYHLRESGIAVAIRHRTGDVLVLDEIFSQLEYEPPPGAQLRAVRRAVDLGANIGLFGVWALDRFPDCELTAFEPDPTNAEVARMCIEANGAGDRWRLVEAAATADDGRVSFVSGEFSRSRIEAEGGTEVEALDVFPYFEGVDFAKVDIEGGEWAILGDPRFRELGLSALALEFHPDQAPGPDPKSLALDAVHTAGFDARVVYEFGPGQGMLWAWRAAR